MSIPAYLAARTMRVPVVVHEANKLAGISNRIGARFAAFTAITFRETELPGSTLIGMPMSSTITHPSVDKVEARRRFPGHAVGGDLGAEEQVRQRQRQAVLVWEREHGVT